MAGEESVYFVVLGLREMRDVGPVVRVRLGAAQEIPPVERELMARGLVGDYPLPILIRHADVLVGTFPADLFSHTVPTSPGMEPFQKPSTYSLAPSMEVARLRYIAAEFSTREAAIPAVLPPAGANQEHDGPVIGVAIVVVDEGERVGQWVTGRRVVYLADGAECPSLDALSREVKSWAEKQTGEVAAVVDPKKDTVYGDVAPVVDTILDAGVSIVNFGSVPLTSSEASGSADLGATPVLQAGQVWNYRVPDGEPPRTLTVQSLVTVRGHGEIAFIKLDDVPHERVGSADLRTEWLPFWSRTLARELQSRVGTAEIPDDLNPVERWQAGFAKGTAGYETRSPWQTVQIYRAMRGTKKLPR